MATPLMDQYHRIKQQHPHDILLYRLGDFYEMFYEDAKTAARVLGITLTSRQKGDSRIPMAGVPYHAAAGYINRLLRAGLRVAVCDQTEEAEEAAGEIVERQVTRVVTPGTLIDEALLEERRNNFLVSVLPAGAQRGLAWIDCSTGAFLAADVTRERLLDELARLAPSECLVPASLAEAAAAPPPGGRALAGDVSGRAADDLEVLRRAVPAVVPVPDWAFDAGNARRALCEHFGTASLDGFGCGDLQAGLGAAGAVLQYLRDTHRAALKHVTRLVKGSRAGTCVLDRASIRSLELTETLREGDRKASLVGVLDRTQTAMGGRLLREWILAPLCEVEAIRRRQEAVREFLERSALREALRKPLQGIGDLERLGGRIGAGRATPRDLGGLRGALAALPRVAEAAAPARAALAVQLRGELSVPRELEDLLGKALADDPPPQMKEGGIFREGWHEELDRFRGTGASGKRWIAEFEAAEIRRTGIGSLKVGFNSVFGYYIEITNTHREKIPADYTRKQTLKNAERYITPALKEREEQVLHAETRSKKLEYELFVELRDRVARFLPDLQRAARALAALDVLAGLAAAAQDHDYVLPLVDDGDVIEVADGRHPVVERAIEGRFVPNDLRLDGNGSRVLILTGPNMAGKSTYIRQAALIVLMAQMGGGVPARSARVGVADRIFTRVGAADDLARGASTFMVEMNETAAILHNATARSLVILDEIGRGTSTYDGLAIAWGVTEHLHDAIKARTLFATHYHELTELARLLPGVKNRHVAVREWGEGVVFLHKIQDGGTDKSYGVHVARLAGIPKAVLERAKAILATLEEASLDRTGRPRIARKPKKPGEAAQLALFAGTPADPLVDTALSRPSSPAPRPASPAPRLPAGASAKAGPTSPRPPSPVPCPSFQPDPLRDALAGLDVNALTPLQALERLAELKKKAENRTPPAENA